MGIEVRPDGSRVLSSYPLVVSAVVGSALSLLSLAPMPYGYYTFSRFAITAMAVWVLIGCYGRERIGWSVAFGAVAVLYNPLFPVYMARESWALFNLLTGALFVVVGCLIKDHDEIGSSASAPGLDGPADVQPAGRTADVNHVAPTPRYISHGQAPETAQISVAAWWYLEFSPIPGSLTVMAGSLVFAPTYQVGDPRAQLQQSWPIPLSEVIAARISCPEGVTFKIPSTIYMTSSTDAFFHLMLRTPGGSIEFALGLDQAGTAALLWETFRQLDGSRHGQPIRPLL